MSIISRIKVWGAEVLKSSDLNGEFNNLINFINNVDNATTTWDNVKATTIAATTLTATTLTTTNALPISSGGTNGNVALVNGRVMGSIGSKITESSGTLNAGSYVIGTIVQTVQVTTNSASAVTSSTYTVTNSTATITPLLSTHKIKITVTGNIANALPASTNAIVTIKRGATDLALDGNGFVVINSSAGVTSLNEAAAIVYLDSPSTVLATTYAVYIKSSDNTHTVTWANAGTAVILLEELAN